ncbi:hypothetical protein OS122_02485 [Mycolicibacterium mucogenicum]|uniref:LtfC-like domain-containing protein n=1 Tax=Mycolicibacterium mucogenicum TaxID=56689 RepID=UPI00226A7A39|nr:hypothetical protein [Mycolicibacterium mucogenicum]MCX8559766.1 hypothetical protein [Mycolicibacterium mucogenicum]
MESLYGAVVLSTGSTWNPKPWERPFLMPSYNGLESFPSDASATAVFSDSSGAVLATVDLDVQPDGIYPDVDATVMDAVPAGANFVITLETNDATNSIRYGQVIRKDPFYAGAVAAAANSLSLSDNMQRPALGSKYVPILGSSKMVDNSGLSLPKGLAANSSPFAARYWTEAYTDSVEIGVTVLNLSPTQQSSLGIVFSADIGFASGLCVQLNAGASGSRNTHIGTLSAPTALIDEVAPVADTVANLDYYLIRYVESTQLVSVYKNQALDTPLISWADTTGIVPKGKGYRNIGVVMQRSSGSATGIQVTSLTARDAA